MWGGKNKIFKKTTNLSTNPPHLLVSLFYCVLSYLSRYVAFTGSREVGLHINKVAATQASGQVWIKRTILEMGGKDAIIVDADADIDSAVEGVAQAAFGFQGQKCSACSRAIVDERIY